jgi:magnesium transporter
MRNVLLAPELRELLQAERTDDLRTIVEDLHPNDAATYLSGLEDHEIVQIMSLLPVKLERDVFSYLDPELQERIVIGSGRPRVKALLTAMGSDDRAGFLERLDERVRQQILPLLAKAAREDLLRREQYDPDQVGSFLSTEYAVLDRELTAPRAIEELRKQEPSKETIYYCYVLDEQSRLIGFVSLRDLIVARADQTVGMLMKSDPVSIEATEDQEAAARLIREYDLLALPVVDEQGRLIGLITHDDAADIVEEEEVEDMELMAGVQHEADLLDYNEQSVLAHCRRRLPIVAMLSLFFALVAQVIAGYEDTLERGGALAIAFLPVVMAIGGNVGGQAAAVVIVGLKLQHLSGRSLFPVLWKELRVSSLMGVVLGTIVLGEAWVLGLSGLIQNDATELPRLAFAIGIALTSHVVTAALLGGAIPLVVRALKGDPALVAHPSLTTLADLLGATIYCGSVLLLLSPEG